nr:MAG TPA: Flp/Fap pilin component [Caudoviricetes sp.]
MIDSLQSLISDPNGGALIEWFLFFVVICMMFVLTCINHN